MPKSKAEIAKESIARKRQRARKAGLCGVCCTQTPNPGRAICAFCTAAKVERQKRKREKNREVKRKYALVAHERAGDIAREHHFYAAAAEHYQDALDACADSPDDYDRISEKLIQALFFSGEPAAASPLYNRLLTSYLARPGNGAEAIGIMLRIARQRWIDSKTTESLPIIMQAIQLAAKIGERDLWILTNLWMHNYLYILGRPEEASRFLSNVPRVDNGYPTSLRISYCRERAVVAAIAGHAAKTYRYYDRVLPLAKKENDLYSVVTIEADCSYFATMLGDVDRAKSCIERALLISRQHHFTWYIPFLCLWYADILVLLGQSRSAFSYLIEALSSDARAPLLERTFAEIGIPLAMQMNDEAALTKCAHPAALTLAFQSEEPESISSVAASFAKLYKARGDGKEAQALLHRAVEAARPIVSAWELPLEVARQGAVADTPRARALLEVRAALPHSNVVRACLCLFDAYVAQRENNVSLTHACAKEAVDRFEALHWHKYMDEARSLLPGVQGTAHPSRDQNVSFIDMQSALTVREKQIAGFVLQGLTNRAIAMELSITENTVEKHMTSIMNRLGVRSRHQLADAVGVIEQ